MASHHHHHHGGSGRKKRRQRRRPPGSTMASYKLPFALSVENLIGSAPDAVPDMRSSSPESLPLKKRHLPVAAAPLPNLSAVTLRSDGETSEDEEIDVVSESSCDDLQTTDAPASPASSTSSDRSSPAPSCGNSPSPSPAGRKARTAFTTEQVMALEERFRLQKYLSAADRETLAKATGLTDEQVKTLSMISCQT